MEVYDLRSQRLHPKEFEKIVSPVYARGDVGREFVVVRGASNPFHTIDGLTLRHRFEFNPNAGFDPLYAQNLNKIERLIDSGEVVLIDQRQRTKVIYPFFISESGELFCVDEAIYNPAFINYIIERYRSNVALFGKPSPTRDAFTPTTDHYGPGYWKTVDNDYHGTKNVLIMAINRLTSMGDEGRVFGSDGKDYMNTSRDKIQQWTALPATLDGESRAFISAKSVIRRYGEERSIYQKYQESDDAWAVSGKSWQWIPGVREEDYEFKK
ncbi:hypothetical protein JK156_02215 [Enterobacter ludwigii]|uniref:hypothetical protein n=1 Tax=Enterobacter ludwigii TaxID=299767 RepID=UPI0010667620|nr:hypothetical protein [Enterobacter ludwigii]MBS0866815.1 hypothetical protein [Enterobacter ludwigii]